MSTTPDDQPDRPVHPPVRPPAPYRDLRVEDIGRPVPATRVDPEFDPSDPLYPGQQLELAALVPPLLDRARELINRDVLVIAGGSRLDGRLVAVDEESLLLTVEDSHYRFFIDLQSVAVLAVGR